MGFWGATLYANDCTADVRDDYKKTLQGGLNNDAAFRQIMSSYADRLGTDEEPLVWYALADTQWCLGRLMPEVRERALWWIKHDGGMCFFGGSASQRVTWKKTLTKLKNKLNSTQPSEKIFRKPTQYMKNPWNVGDVYAYCFNSAEAIEKGYYGKYILLQKLEDNDFFGDRLSLIQVYDKLFDEIPVNVKLEEMRILPFSLPMSFMPSGKNETSPKLALCAVLAMDKKQCYPYKHLTYICTEPVPTILYNRVTWGYLFDWCRIEHTLLFYYPLWQEYVYELFENESIVAKKECNTDTD